MSVRSAVCAHMSWYCMQALPVVQGEPRRGRTPVEEQMWLKLHETYVAEVKQLEKTVRSWGPCIIIQDHSKTQISAIHDSTHTSPHCTFF